jgi:hypothetical protein
MRTWPTGSEAGIAQHVIGDPLNRCFSSATPLKDVVIGSESSAGRVVVATQDKADEAIEAAIKDLQKFLMRSREEIIMDIVLTNIGLPFINESPRIHKHVSVTIEFFWTPEDSKRMAPGNSKRTAPGNSK